MRLDLSIFRHPTDPEFYRARQKLTPPCDCACCFSARESARRPTVEEQAQLIADRINAESGTVRVG